MAQSLPPIVISEKDYRRLSELSDRTAHQLPKVSGFLAAELDRARIVPDDEVPGDVVTMGAELVFRMDATGEGRKVTLVYPDKADILEGRLSILTPVGTALLGLSPGQSMSWQDRTGDIKTLTLQSVLSQPAGEAVVARR
ncbi:MAG: nucleoside diphosphate kinase regulator [Alphaproteobacteria bacterium]